MQVGALFVLLIGAITAVHLLLHLAAAAEEQHEITTGIDYSEPLVQASSASLPANKSTYTGMWHKIIVDDRLNNSLFLRGADGEVVINLNIEEGAIDGVQNLLGDALLKDGSPVMDNGLKLKIKGIYINDTGRVHALAFPVHRIPVRLTREEQEEGGPDYRGALRRVAYQWSDNRPLLPDYGMDPRFQLPLLKMCSFSLQLDVSALENHKNSNGSSQNKFRGDLQLDGAITSENCNVELSLNTSVIAIEAYYPKVIHYTLATTVITFLQILLLIKQIEGTTAPSAAVRVSLLTITQQAAIDASLCLLHLTAGIWQGALFNAFAMVSFFEFVLFAIFEMRYMLLVWRAQRGNITDPWDTRRDLWVLYTRFYGVLMAGVMLAYTLRDYIKLLMFVPYSFWIPQIVHCIRSDVRQPLKPIYLVGTSLTRLFFPLYVFGCPSSFLPIDVAPTACIALCIYVMMQVLLLLIQYYFGPTWFVPRCFLPDKHDYFRLLTQEECEQLFGTAIARGDEETAQISVECVICMNLVDVRRSMSRMVTPCSHFFHPHCLQRWMDVKMECPTCRQPLPPL